MSNPELDSDPFDTLQQLLAPLSGTPGAIIVRGPIYWEALPPGHLGQVLAIGEDLMPGWFWPDDLPGGGSL